LRKIARARLRDAAVLAGGRRYDGAVYLCGYVVELALKARVCRALHWPSFPSTRREFEGYSTFRTHDLDRLLHLSGAEPRIKARHLAEWSVVVRWDPEVRYRPIGSAGSQDARDMVTSATTILRAL
jgi:HEPN domain-containing protein